MANDASPAVSHSVSAHERRVRVRSASRSSQASASGSWFSDRFLRVRPVADGVGPTVSGRRYRADDVGPTMSAWAVSGRFLCASAGADGRSQRFPSRVRHRCRGKRREAPKERRKRSSPRDAYWGPGQSTVINGLHSVPPLDEGAQRHTPARERVEAVCCVWCGHNANSTGSRARKTVPLLSARAHRSPFAWLRVSSLRPASSGIADSGADPAP